MSTIPVEANKNLFTELSSKYENNNRVKLFNNAICENSNRIKFYLSAYKTKFGSSIYSSKRNVDASNFIWVDGYSFSDFVNKHISNFKNSVNVLKLNIEGAEIDVYENLVKNNNIFLLVDK